MRGGDVPVTRDDGAVVAAHAADDVVHGRDHRLLRQRGDGVGEVVLVLERLAHEDRHAGGVAVEQL